jgi:hypothetical protein
MNLREKQVYDNFLKAIDEIVTQKPYLLINAGTSSMSSNPGPGPVNQHLTKSIPGALPFLSPAA